jgi:hypothetical protein
MLVATVGLLAIARRVGMRQLALLRRQNEIIDNTLRATKASASATQAMTDHARATERPWVAVFVEDKEVRWGGTNKVLGPSMMDVLRSWRASMPTPEHKPEVFRIKWRATNYGSIPGRIVRGTIEFKCLDWELPAEPPYGDVKPIAPMPLPDKSVSHCADTPDLILPSEWCEPFAEGKKAVVLFGFVDYLDTLDRAHTTRFCWVWRVNENGDLQFAADGPPAWHQYT